ncbi:hypothetical protein [Kribbella deserti]|uniref:Uncharacterized protein n=1 Tax=Kribbella deserti TaxID=1926257 RepID=A0ABV6QNP7_9ACTN
MTNTEQPYADAVAALLKQDYDLQDITLPKVVREALDGWLRSQIDLAIAMHAATHGNGHQPDDRCESWYALQDALTHMHDGSHRFVQALLGETTP